MDLKFIPITSLTDKEVKFVLKEVLSAKDVIIIKRDEEYETIDVEVTAMWQDCDNENAEWYPIKDEATLTYDSIEYLDFEYDRLQYKKILLSFGCSKLLQDNKYLD